MSVHDIIIIGGGPAGLTAGLYASRAGLKALLIERGAFGGQMVNARMIENYPGFPEGISGMDLGSLMKDQAVRHGLETLFGEVEGLAPGHPHRVSSSEGMLEAKAVIIATGARYRPLGVPREEELLGRGVSYCATCDGFFFRGQDVAVIGGGDTAVSDALELSHHARKVYLIHRRDQLRAGQVLAERLLAEPRIEPVWNSVVDEIEGEQRVSGIGLKNVKTGDRRNLPVNGVFVAVGVVPESGLFSTALNTDADLSIAVGRGLETSASGIYAAGDVRGYSPRQVASAVGDGVTAALSAVRYVQEYR